MDPLIIEVALNGATQKESNPNVPREPAEVAADALACIKAGAQVMHSHCNWTNDRKAETKQYLEAYSAVVKEFPDAILYPTIGSGNGPAEFTHHMVDLAAAGVLRMGFLDPGSCNLSTSTPDGLPGKTRMVYANSFTDIEYMLDLLAKLKLVPNMAIYEPNFLRGAILYNRAGRMPNGFVKFYFSGEENFVDKGKFLFFGLCPTKTGLEAYLEMLQGCDMPWATAVMGGDSNRCGMTKLAIERGGHVRIGLEDFGGARKPSNLELVHEAIDIAKQCGRPLATMEQTAEILGLRR
jgi:3-keto-5-aminohexanoate cleavage enzyme